MPAAAVHAAAAPRPRAKTTGLPKAEHAVVVLGSPANPDGTPRPPLRRRLDKALDVLRGDPRAVAIVTGGAVYSAVPEAHAMKRYLIDHGIDPDRVVVEDQARITLENAERVVPLLRGVGASRLTLVTERFHMNRSRALVDRALDAAGLGRVRVVEEAAPDELDAIGAQQRGEKELRSLARDLENQRLLHLGKPLEIDIPRVVPSDAWTGPAPALARRRALLGTPEAAADVDAAAVAEAARRARAARAPRTA